MNNDSSKEEYVRRELSTEDRTLLKNLLEEALGSDNSPMNISQEKIRHRHRQAVRTISRKSSLEKETSSDEIENTPLQNIQKSKFKAPRNDARSISSKGCTSKYFRNSRKCSVTSVSMIMASTSTQSSISGDSYNEFMWKLRTHKPIPFRGGTGAITVTPALYDITEESVQSSVSSKQLEHPVEKKKSDSSDNSSPEMKRHVPHLKYTSNRIYANVASPTRSDSGVEEGSQENSQKKSLGKIPQCFVALTKYSQSNNNANKSIDDSEIDNFFKENITHCEKSLSPSKIRELNMSSSSDSDVDMTFDDKPVSECLQNIVNMVCEAVSPVKAMNTKSFNITKQVNLSQKIPQPNSEVQKLPRISSSSPKTPKTYSAAIRETTLTSGKKRKLYSPKDCENLSKTTNSPSSPYNRGQKSRFPSNAVSYDDIEMARSVKKKTFLQKRGKKRSPSDKSKSDVEDEISKQQQNYNTISKANVYDMSYSSDSEFNSKAPQNTKRTRKQTKRQPKRKAKGRLCYQSPTKVEKMFDELRAASTNDDVLVSPYKILPPEEVWNVSSDSDADFLPPEKPTCVKENSICNKENTLPTKKKRAVRSKKGNKRKLPAVEKMRKANEEGLDCSIIGLEGIQERSDQLIEPPREGEYSKEPDAEILPALPVEIVEQVGNPDDSIVSNFSEIVKGYLIHDTSIGENDIASLGDMKDVSYSPEKIICDEARIVDQPVEPEHNETLVVCNEIESNENITAVEEIVPAVALSVPVTAEYISLSSNEVQIMHTERPAEATNNTSNSKFKINEASLGESDFSDADPSRPRRRSLSCKRPHVSELNENTTREDTPADAPLNKPTPIEKPKNIEIARVSPTSKNQRPEQRTEVVIDDSDLSPFAFENSLKKQTSLVTPMLIDNANSSSGEFDIPAKNDITANRSLKERTNEIITNNFTMGSNISNVLDCSNESEESSVENNIEENIEDARLPVNSNKANDNVLEFKINENSKATANIEKKSRDVVFMDDILSDAKSTTEEYVALNTTDESFFDMNTHILSESLTKNVGIRKSSPRCQQVKKNKEKPIIDVQFMDDHYFELNPEGKQKQTKARESKPLSQANIDFISEDYFGLNAVGKQKQTKTRERQSRSQANINFISEENFELNPEVKQKQTKAMESKPRSHADNDSISEENESEVNEISDECIIFNEKQVKKKDNRFEIKFNIEWMCPGETDKGSRITEKCAQKTNKCQASDRRRNKSEEKKAELLRSKPSSMHLQMEAISRARKEILKIFDRLEAELSSMH